MRRSIEVEYWVTDEDGTLTDPGGLLDAAPGVEREFVVPLIEVKTTPCATTAELREELFGRLRRVLDRAEARGKRLVPLATPLDHDRIDERPDERTRIQNRVVGDAFEYVRHCAGTHVHVEQQPGHATDQLNALIALDPALALVNSAPYFRGERLAAGARSKLYRWMAYEKVPHQGRLWSYVSEPGEWRRRVERRFEEFRTAAMDTGVDRRAVEANFDPESAVWTPVQLRETFGTVEWRSPDTALPSQVVRLADAVADVAAQAVDGGVTAGAETGRVVDGGVRLPEFETVLDCLDEAVREGLTSTAVQAYLDRMGFDVERYEPLAHELDGPETLSTGQARRLRLEYADRLAEDVR